MSILFSLLLAAGSTAGRIYFDHNDPISALSDGINDVETGRKVRSFLHEFLKTDNTCIENAVFECLQQCRDEEMKLLLESIGNNVWMAKSRFQEVCWRQSEEYRSGKACSEHDTEEIRQGVYKALAPVYDKLINRNEILIDLLYQILGIVQPPAPEIPHEVSRGTPRTLCLYREAEIADIKTLLQTDNHLVLVNGFGGVGKTTVARELYRELHGEYRYCGWVNYHENLEQSLLLDFVWPKAETPQEKQERIRDFLRTNPEKKLLIIDNVGKEQEQDSFLRELRNKENLTLILTSRLPKIQGYPTKQVGFLGEEQSMELFIRYYKEAGGFYEDSQRETVRELVKLVHCHTLSVEILAKSAEREEGLEAYLVALQKAGFQYPDLPVESEYEKGSHIMAEYLKILFNLRDRTPEEIRILQNFSLMPSMEIPAKVTEWIKCEKKGLYLLVDTGWLEFHQKTPDHPAGYYMHPLVKEIIRLDREAFPESIGTEFADCLREGTYFEENETYVTVFPKLEIADSVLKGMGERETAEYGVACNNLACQYKSFGLYDRAEEYHLKDLAVSEKVLGTEHPDTATTYDNLAVLYENQGAYDRAKEYHLKALAVSEKVLGTEHPATAATYNNLAVLYENQGAYGRAEEYHLKALAVSEKVLGTEHPDTATTYNNLALLYQAQGAYGRAEEYYLKALAVSEKVLGTEHPDTATTYNNLAGLYWAQGAYDWAEEYYEKALTVREKVLGTEHPTTATTRHNIGCLYYAQGDYDGAMEQFLRAFWIWTKVFGAKHPNVKTVLKWISDTYPKTTYAHKQPFEEWRREHGLELE